MSERLDFDGCAGGVEGLGPGRRVVVWVRGCGLACPGCVAPELWAPGRPDDRVTVAAVAELVKPLLREADGLTISGGEPMDQPAALAALVRLLRREVPELEVLVYTGYLLEALRGQGGAVVDLLEEIDMLIDGRFEQGTANTLRWRGSDNQRVHYLTERGGRHREEELMPDAARPLQVQMLADQRFRIIGIPRRGDMARYRRLMQQRGVTVRKVKE